MAGRRGGSSLSLGERPVECFGSRRRRCPRRPGERSPCRPPGPRRLTGPGRAGRWPTGCALSSDVPGGSLHCDSVSLRSRPRRRGRRRSAACACRSTVRAAQRGARQTLSTESMLTTRRRVTWSSPGSRPTSQVPLCNDSWTPGHQGRASARREIARLPHPLTKTTSSTWFRGAGRKESPIGYATGSNATCATVAGTPRISGASAS